jgi:hypothetical protein
MIWRDAERECHCRLDEPPQDQAAKLDDRDRKVLSDVETYGWHIVDIHDDSVTQGWTFSVGMWHTLGSPELAIFGVPSPHGANVINEIGDMVKAGRSIGPDVVFDDALAAGRLVGFRPAHSTWYGPLFGYATWFAQQPPLPVAQVVWADPEGKFPWDEELDPDFRSLQPSLWVPVPDHPISRWSGAGRRDWMFPAPPIATAFTTIRVVDGAPIVHVAHDTDGAWQFIDEDAWERADIQISHLAHIVDADPTLASISDLPPGWQASREHVGGSWTRSPLSPGPDDPPDPPRRRRFPWSRRS